MKLKNIITQLFNLPNGKYICETTFGKLEIQNIVSEDGRFNKNNLYIKLNGKNFIEANKCNKNFEIINFKTLNEKDEYILVYKYDDEIKLNTIECFVDDIKYTIYKNRILNHDTTQLFGVYNNVLNYETKNIEITHNLENNEKFVYLKTNSETIPTKLNITMLSIIKKYNKLVEMINHSLLDSIKEDEDLKCFKDELTKLASQTQIPLIDIPKIEKLSKEISLIGEIYKKYIPYINEEPNEELIYLLESVASVLTKEYGHISNTTQKEYKLSKKFNIDNYKNNK